MQVGGLAARGGQRAVVEPCTFDEQHHAATTPRGQRVHVAAKGEEPLVVRGQWPISVYKGDCLASKARVIVRRDDVRSCQRRREGGAVRAHPGHATSSVAWCMRLWGDGAALGGASRGARLCIPCGSISSASASRCAPYAGIISRSSALRLSVCR
eukprot:3172327-Prymnesium_polylepis.2